MRERLDTLGGRGVECEASFRCQCEQRINYEMYIGLGEGKDRLGVSAWFSRIGNQTVPLNIAKAINVPSVFYTSNLLIMTAYNKRSLIIDFSLIIKRLYRVDESLVDYFSPCGLV